MPMQEIWQNELGGILTAELGEFRLVVHRPDKLSRLVRFLVLRHKADGDCLVSSGTEMDVRAAMRTAVQAASRLVALPPKHGAGSAEPIRRGAPSSLPR